MIIKRILTSMMAVILVLAAYTPTVRADTDGNEIRITDQPDKLVLQLGPQWAGLEFELKTDAGVYPAPVFVDESGILKMDLGGSKTYTLSCLSSPIAANAPNQSESTVIIVPEVIEFEGDAELVTSQTEKLIPTGVLIMFICGLLVAVGGLITIRYFKHRRESYDFDDDDDYE